MSLSFPTIYLLPNRLNADELHELEEHIPTLTYDINEAEVLLGKVSQKERALFELRRLKLATEESLDADEDASAHGETLRRIHDPEQAILDTDSDTTSERSIITRRAIQANQNPEVIRVVRLAWFTDSVRKGIIQPYDGYLVYKGRRVLNSLSPKPPGNIVTEPLDRARADREPSQTSPHSGHSQDSSRRHRRQDGHVVKPPPVLKQTTTEHDLDMHLPPVPDYLHTTYSCQRPTPVGSPNEAFIDQLSEIRKSRTLMADKIGVRAYSSAIATVAAYPHTLSSAHEVARLPGCGLKIGMLFQEFKEHGHLQEVRDAESDPRLSVLRLFYNIWGVAEATARDFYNRGWRDIDDIVEHGWGSLTRVQQIGVKYYDEFLLKIPRAEAGWISSVILEHATKIHEGFEMVVVGGYRRGKEESGDVDVVLSHRDESATLGFAEKIVFSLEKGNYITHTLTLSTANSERGQMPVSWKGNDRKGGTGFDTLDKALVVWQDPRWSAAEGKTGNPNPHRRVDIIISPWKTAGCAVLGWSGGNTFQRDIRRYCKNERSLKFDSSGVRSRLDGSWVDLESGPDGPASDMETAERRVFAGLGLEYRRPEERCTG